MICALRIIKESATIVKDSFFPRDSVLPGGESESGVLLGDSELGVVIRGLEDMVLS